MLELQSYIEVNTEEDIVEARKSGRLIAQAIGFEDVVQAQIATAVSELAHNIYLYAQKGVIKVSAIEDETKVGLVIIAQDCGPGISDLHHVLAEEQVPAKTTIAGLAGVKLVMDDFSINTSEEGTEIHVTKWLQKTEEPEDAR